MRYPEHYGLKYIQHAAKYLKNIEHITITGGEPSLNPDFKEIVPNLKNWFGSQSLSLETNGAKIIENKDVLSFFDDVLISHYPNNEEAVEFLAARNQDSRPTGPTIHVTKARRAKNPAPCRRANFGQYVYGRLYPCTYVPDGCEDIGIPLTENWREEISKVPLPCAQCCFANEREDEELHEIENETSAPSMPLPVSLDKYQPEQLEQLRPPWRFPPAADDVKIYGLDVDSWMGEQAEICIDPARSMDQLMILFESHLPNDSYPITITFTDSRNDVITTLSVANAGVSGKKLKIPEFIKLATDHMIRVHCDKSISKSRQDTSRANDRTLGVRIRAVRYISSPRAGEKAPLYDENIRLLEQLSRELHEKEQVIQKLQRATLGLATVLPKLKKFFSRQQ